MSNYSLPSGTKLGEYYEIRGLLGSGGFGITYKAWDAEFQRVVAIKEYFPFDLSIRLPGSNMVVPRDEGTKDYFESGMAQFVEEGRTLAKFADDRIVRATNFVRMNDTVYMVMEYQEGSPLSQFMAGQEGPLSEEQIMSIFVPVMQALEKVHRAEILHRDLKPDNIYIRNDGTPVLLDFGAARQRVVGQTRSLTSMLSPGYAPLEQYHTRGNQGPWTDIYALGATMYFCTTGRRPEDVTARIGASHMGNPDPMLPATQVVPRMYSETLLSTIDWMLRLNDRDRPQSLAEVLDRLEKIESKPGATVVLSPVKTEVVTSKIKTEDAGSDAKTEKFNIESVDAVRPSRKNRKSIALYSLLGLIAVGLIGLGYFQWSKRDDQVTNVERKILPEESPSESVSASTDREEAARLAEEQRQKEEAARLAEEQRQKEEAARLAEEQRQKEEAARLAEEQRQKEEAARLAEEQRQKEEAARLAEEQRQKEEAARLAEEQRQKEEAARLAEEQRQKEEAARLAEEQRQKEEAARLAEEQRQKEEAARLAEEQRQKEEAARLAEEQRQKEEAARLAEEQRQKEEAARLAEEQRQKEEAARLAEEQRQKEEAARLAEEQRQKEEEPKKLTEEEKAAKDQLLWSEAQNTDTRNSYQAYLKECILCTYTMAALSRIDELWREEAERLAEEQRKKEEAARTGE